MPITDTATALHLRTLNAMFAAGTAEAAIQSTHSAVFSGTVGHMYLAEFEAGLKELRLRGNTVGATTAPGGESPRGQADLLTGGDDEDPLFTVTDRW